MIEYTANPVYTDIWAVAAGFSASPESVRLYGEEFGPATVNAIYQNLFNRDAEAEGITYWLGEVAAGRLTPAGVAYAILLGAQNEDATTVANKMQVATEFYASLDTTEEMIGYSGDAAAAAARAFLATVDGSEGSVEQALAGLDDAVAGVVDSGGPTGDSFELKVGKDVIVGTAGNDTIEAAGASGGVLGTQTSTLETFDSIDGGAGRDTMNIYVGGEDFNTGWAVNGRQVGTIKNVEIVNIYNNVDLGASFGEDQGGIDASKFQGAEQIWQHGITQDDGYVYKVSSGTTIGFADMEGEDMWVEAADAEDEVNVALKNVGDGFGSEGYVSVWGESLDTVTVTGSLATADDEENNYVTLEIWTGEGAEALTLATAVDSDLYVYTDWYGPSEMTAIDASDSTGGIRFIAQNNSTAEGAGIATVRTGSGDDEIRITALTAKDDVGTVADETVNALVDAGAGDDIVRVDTDRFGGSTGTTTVMAGAGDDLVRIITRGSGKLAVDLGAGDDDFRSDVDVGATDVVDAGDGTDTLLLRLVGASNIGAFSNFEVFDVDGLGKTLDVEILSSKNSVTEIVTSGAVGDGTLINLGAGVGFRSVSSFGDTLTLTQKTGGAMTVTVDADIETETPSAVKSTVVATNATSLNAVFDADFSADLDNKATLNLTGSAATTLAVDSGGSGLTNNTLNYVYGLGTASAGLDGKLTAVTVTGDQHLILRLESTDGNDLESNVATVDASASTGGLTFNTADLKSGGAVSLGSGADEITVANTSVVGAMESVVGFEKAAASALDGTSALAIADSDKLFINNSSVAPAETDTDNGLTISGKGVVTFVGSGPATLDEALAWVAADTSAGQVVVFQYINDSYVFFNTGTDRVVKLTGVTGVTALVEAGGDTNTYILG